MPEPDQASFEDLGDIEIPTREDPKVAKVTAQVEEKIQAEQIEKQVRQETGTEKEKKGTLAPEFPKAMFSIVAGFIDCPKFNLDDMQAKIYADSINILFPVEGKAVALLNIIVITLGKIVTCFDAIKKKFGKPEEPVFAKESKDPRDSIKKVYTPEMDTKKDQEV